MAKDPAFLFYPGDYLRDTQCLSENVQVAYDRIMCEHMRNICISKQQLKFFTKRLTEDELNELMMVLTKHNGGYQIEWVVESIEKRRKYSESRRNNRKGTKKDMSYISKTYDLHMENENENTNEYESVIEIWNTFATKHNLSKIIKLTETRIKYIKARLGESDFDLGIIFDAIEKSDFLLGKKSDWKIDFDFIFKSKDNYIKILENKYGGNSVKYTAEQLKKFAEVKASYFKD